MTSINVTSQQIAAVLRTQIAALVQPDRLVKAKTGHASSLKSNKKSTTQDFAERMALRVQGLSLDDPLFKKKVMRIFLESVISAELGEALPNDVRFSTMIDSVQRQMEADPELSTMIRLAFNGLLHSKGKGSATFVL